MDKKTLENHKNWVKKHIPRYWVPKDLDEYFKECWDAKTKIRDLLGYHTIKISVELKNSPKFITNKTGVSLVKDLKTQIPQYIQKYKIPPNELYYPYLKSQGGIATSKHVLGYCVRQKFPTQKTAVVGKLVSELGGHWADCKGKYETFDFIVSCHPAFYHLMGQFTQVDTCSCFKAGGMNSDKKYAIALHPDCLMFAGANDNLNCFLKEKDIDWDNLTIEQKNTKTRGICKINWQDQNMFFFNVYSNISGNLGGRYITANLVDLYELLLKKPGVWKPYDKEIYQGDNYFSGGLRYGSIRGYITKKGDKNLPDINTNFPDRYLNERQAN